MGLSRSTSILSIVVARPRTRKVNKQRNVRFAGSSTSGRTHEEEKQRQLPKSSSYVPSTPKDLSLSTTDLDIELFLELLEFVFFRLVRLDELLQCVLDLRCGYQCGDIV